MAATLYTLETCFVSGILYRPLIQAIIIMMMMMIIIIIIAPGKRGRETELTGRSRFKEAKLCIGL